MHQPYWLFQQLPTQDPGICPPDSASPDTLHSAHYLSCPNPLSPPLSSPCVPVHPMVSPPPFLLALALRLWEESEDMKTGCYSHPKSRRGNSKTQIPITSRIIHPPDFSLSPRYPGSGSISPGTPGASSSNRIFLCSSRSPSDGAGLGESI